MKTKYLLVPVALLIVTSCTQKQVDNSGSRPVPDIDAPLDVNGITWQTYTYPRHSFSFNYPPLWKLTEENLVEKRKQKKYETAQLVVTIQSPDRSLPPKQLEFVMYANPYASNPAGRPLDFVRIWNNAPAVERYNATVIISSLPFHIIDLNNEMKGVVAYLNVDSTGYVLEDVYGSLQGGLFEEILSTFKFGGSGCDIHSGLCVPAR